MNKTKAVLKEAFGSNIMFGDIGEHGVAGEKGPMGDAGLARWMSNTSSTYTAASAIK